MGVICIINLCLRSDDGGKINRKVVDGFLKESILYDNIIHITLDLQSTPERAEESRKKQQSKKWKEALQSWAKLTCVVCFDRLLWNGNSLGGLSRSDPICCLYSTCFTFGQWTSNLRRSRAIVVFFVVNNTQKKKCRKNSTGVKKNVRLKKAKFNSN